MVDNRSSVTVLDLGSQFLAGQAGFRQLGKCVLIELLIRRLAESSLLDAIAVTGPRPQGSQLEKLSIEPAGWYPSDAGTALGRVIEVALATNATWVVLLQANAAFVDPLLIDRLIAAAWATPTSDVISFASSTRPPASPQSVGLIAEIFSRRALRRLASVVSVGSDDRPVGRMLLSLPELFQPRYLPLPKALDRDDVRWVLETEEDWERARLLLDSNLADRDYREFADLALHCDHHRLRP